MVKQKYTSRQLTEGKRQLLPTSIFDPFEKEHRHNNVEENSLNSKKWLDNLWKPLRYTNYFQSLFPINKVYENYFLYSKGAVASSLLKPTQDFTAFPPHFLTHIRSSHAKGILYKTSEKIVCNQERLDGREMSTVATLIEQLVEQRLNPHWIYPPPCILPGWSFVQWDTLLYNLVDYLHLRNSLFQH